jgi:hypothetical protein
MRLLKLLLLGTLLLGASLPMTACKSLQDFGESVRDTID